MNRRQNDRRLTEKFFVPRQFLRREKLFIYERRIYLSDTNSFQNVYFAKYYEFLGEAREELLRYLMKENTPKFSINAKNINV